MSFWTSGSSESELLCNLAPELDRNAAPIAVSILHREGRRLLGTDNKLSLRKVLPFCLLRHLHQPQLRRAPRDQLARARHSGARRAANCVRCSRQTLQGRLPSYPFHQPPTPEKNRPQGPPVRAIAGWSPPLGGAPKRAREVRKLEVRYGKIALGLMALVCLQTSCAVYPWNLHAAWNILRARELTLRGGVT